jgi:hypothetical protein
MGTKWRRKMKECERWKERQGGRQGGGKERERERDSGTMR